MRTIALLAGLGALVAACSSGLEDAEHFRFHTDAPAKLRTLLSREGADVAGGHERLGFVDVLATREAADRLAAEFRALVRGVEVIGRDARLLSDYLDPDEVAAFLDQVESDHPAIARKVLLAGGLPEGHEIWAMKISDDVESDEDEPTFLLEGQIHANEVMGAEVLVDAIEWLTANYATQPEVARWVDGMEIWIVPVVNPDGAAHMFAHDSLWRKNRNDACPLGTGVDLNRNFAWSFAQCGTGDDCWENDYRGAEAFSEAESRAIRDLVETLRPLYTVHYHSFGEVIAWPGGCGRVDEHELFAGVAGELNAIVETDNGQTGDWALGAAPEVLYEAPGSAMDHAYGAGGSVALTIELNSLGFQPDHALFRDVTVQRQRTAWGHLLDRTLDGPAVRGHTFDAVTTSPVVATYRFQNHPFTSGQLTLRSDAEGRFGRVVMPDSDHLVIFTSPGYLPESRQVHVGAGPVDLAVPMTAGVNHEPQADAGVDQIANEGDWVLLDGSASSDPDGNALLYEWVQTAGPVVALVDPNTDRPGFLAPSVHADAVLAFSLRVSDGELNSAFDSVAVTVRDLWNQAFVFPSTDTPLSIPDANPSGVTSVIHVVENGQILEAEVQVDVTHTWIGDLRITLTSPAGTEAVLHDHEGGTQNNLHATYRPAEFVGEMSAGDWVLHVLDAKPFNTGSLDGWTLVLDLVGAPPCTTASDCDLPHARDHECVLGRCEVLACDTGFGDCNGWYQDGCELNLWIDVAHCGDCDRACDLPGVEAHVCSAGICRIGSCVSELVDCNDSPEDGCETRLGSQDHCGGCNDRCGEDETCEAVPEGFGCVAGDPPDAGLDGADADLPVDGDEPDAGPDAAEGPDAADAGPGDTGVDSGKDAGAGESPAGCGCSSGGHPCAVWLPVLPVVLRRRWMAR